MKFDKSKVYTAVNADEVKIGSMGFFADNIENLQDVIENEDKSFFGKITEIRSPSENFRFIKLDADGSSLNYNLFYLVSEPKEKKYRPYKDTDEMIEDFLKRFNSNVPKNTMPFIWLKNCTAKSLISGFGKYYVCIESKFLEMKELFEDYIYLDGSPCGKLEEQK